MDKLTEWLTKEAEVALASAGIDEFSNGYYGAIINTLDFLQGAEVYIQSLEEK